MNTSTRFDNISNVFIPILLKLTFFLSFIPMLIHRFFHSYRRAGEKNEVSSLLFVSLSPFLIRTFEPYVLSEHHERVKVHRHIQHQYVSDFQAFRIVAALFVLCLLAVHVLLLTLLRSKNVDVCIISKAVVRLLSITSCLYVVFLFMTIVFVVGCCFYSSSSYSQLLSGEGTLLA